jgi:Zn-dependent protease
MQRYMLQTRLFATRICIHWQFLIALPVFWLATRSAAGGVLAFISLIALMLAHEFGHAALARYYGLKVERIELHLLQGWCIFAEPEYEIEAIIISWGGVLVQLALLVVFEASYHAARFVSPAYFHLLNPIFAVFIAWNAISLVVNLLPVEGLEGSLAWKIVPAIGNGTFARYLRSKRHAFQLAHPQGVERTPVQGMLARTAGPPPEITD